MSFKFGNLLKIPDVDKMYNDMAADLPDYVTCPICNKNKTVNVAECLRKGWPKCECGLVMMYLGRLSK